METPKITIPISEYARLERRDRMLACLEQCSIETWAVFDTALELYKDLYGEAYDAGV